jgi:LysM repeat protein
MAGSDFGLSGGAAAILFDILRFLGLSSGDRKFSKRPQTGGDTHVSKLADMLGITPEELSFANPQLDADKGGNARNGQVVYSGSGEVAYIVKRGDTMSAIARRNGVSLGALIDANPHISNPNFIRPGEVLFFPLSVGGQKYGTNNRDVLSGIAARFGISTPVLMATNKEIIKAGEIKPGQLVQVGVGPESPRGIEKATTAGQARARENAQIHLTQRIIGTIDLVDALDPAKGSQSLMAIVVGNAEGNRRPDGSFKSSVNGHIDPGNSKRNIGSFSLQGAPGLTAGQADTMQLGRLRAQLPAYTQAARAAGLAPNNALLAASYFDLYNQSPSAAGRFLRQMEYLGDAGISQASVNELRFRSFINSETGQRWTPGTGRGFMKIARDRYGAGATEANFQKVIADDQARRTAGIMDALKEQNVVSAAPALRMTQARRGAPSEAIATTLPATGAGYVTYNRERAGADQNGTARFVESLQQLGTAWAEQSDTPIAFGDMSRAGGGTFRPHSSHKQGNEVDVRPFRTDGRSAPTDFTQATYDREMTRQFVQLVRERHPDAVILFNDPVLIREGLTKYYSGHDNHLHMKLP